MFNILLTIHIIFGATSLLLGLIILSAKKGNKTHEQLGKIFFYAMLINATVSLPMAIMHSSYFLFLVGFFTLYMLITGVRYLNKKSIEDIHTLDWLLTLIMFVSALGFIAFGLNLFFLGSSFGIVFMVFGLIGLLFCKKDYENFKGNAKMQNFFLLTHIQRMTGSYIATTTAFLVVTNKILPDILAWLLPTILFTPLIFIWSKKYAVKKLKPTI